MPTDDRPGTVVALPPALSAIEEPSFGQIDLMTAFAQAVANEIRPELNSLQASTQQTHTEVIDQSHRLERLFDQSEFWIQTVATLLQPERRSQIELDLTETIRSWQKLPAVSQHQLITARYLTDDPALLSAERVPAAIRALGLSVESVAHAVLPELPPRAMLGAICEHVAKVSFGWPDFQFRLQTFTDKYRNPASHNPVRLTSDDLSDAWRMILGTKGEPGLVETFASLR